MRVSDPGSPPKLGETPRADTAAGAGSILDRAAAPALATLRAPGPGHPGYPATADALAGALRDGTLSGHLTPKALGALAAQLLESLPTPGDHAD